MSLLNDHEFASPKQPSTSRCVTSVILPSSKQNHLPETRAYVM